MASYLEKGVTMNWGPIQLQHRNCNVHNYRRSRLLLALTLGLLLICAPFFIFESFYLDFYRYITSGYREASAENNESFLVWNRKCHIPARKSLDPSIRRFVRREKFEGCTETRLLTRIAKVKNGKSLVLKIDARSARSYKGVSCCWAPVCRGNATRQHPRDIDSQIRVGDCMPFERKVILPHSVEVTFVKCSKEKRGKIGNKRKTVSEVYRNVHSVIPLEKVRDKAELNKAWNGSRKLSVLLLGIDTVSRLNFARTMPKTQSRLKQTGWIEYRAYNKMADNTYPNLMAILTGLNSSEAYDKCSPTRAYGLDNCPFLWYDFRDARYVTAYGEDVTDIGTFNHLKVGFVDPPTDYYLRPYVRAAEKFLSAKTRSHSQHYCTGPELSAERIFNYAEDFAKTFIGTPYFGFFWTNSLTHDDINGLSAVDGRFSGMFERLDNEGVLNDAMVIFLSDHGARYGAIRETFQGWYEDRLPFLYVWLPKWFRTRDVEAWDAVRTNANRLVSPFDIHEMLRDVLIRAGGDAAPAPACPSCQSIFRPIATDRGCDDAGISPHWCACTAFEPGNVHDAIATRGADMFVEHVNDVVRGYRDAKGERLCAQMKLKRIIRIEENTSVQDRDGVPSERIFLCLLQVTPGDGKFEVTIRYKVDGNFSISDKEVSRINVYGNSAKCLTSGNKNYCHCL